MESLPGKKDYFYVQEATLLGFSFPSNKRKERKSLVLLLQKKDIHEWPCTKFKVFVTLSSRVMNLYETSDMSLSLITFKGLSVHANRTHGALYHGLCTEGYVGGSVDTVYQREDCEARVLLHLEVQVC